MQLNQPQLSARLGLLRAPVCHAQLHTPEPGPSNSRRSHVTRSSSGVLQREGSILDTARDWRSGQSLQPEPQPEYFGGGGGGGGRVGVGHSRDGGSEDGDSGGLSLPWNPLQMVIAGLQARAEADPSFLFKLGCECGLDLAIILTVNLACRREKFLRELDFVLSQCCVSLLCDFALVYLLAPTVRQSVAAKGRLSRKIASLPSHVFQSPPPGQPGFTLAQRAACFFVKAGQYGAVGFVMGCAGSALVHAMTAARERFDAAFEPPPTEQPIAGTGLGWLYFMGLNSNVRYNALNAAEDILYARFPGTRSKMLSVVLRLCNNFFGAHAWMGCAKALNLNRPRAVRRQKKDDRFLDPSGTSIALS